MLIILLRVFLGIGESNFPKCCSSISKRKFKLQWQKQLLKILFVGFDQENSEMKDELRKHKLSSCRNIAPFACVLFNLSAEY